MIDRLAPVRRGSTAIWPAWRFTHLQPAQPTTVGKRACLWAYDLVLDLAEIEHRLAQLKARGTKGTTGTQASFLALFDGDHAKVRAAGASWSAEKMGFDATLRRHRPDLLRARSTAQVAGRALGHRPERPQDGHRPAAAGQHRKEMEEPFETEQIGSSAMAYKRNPMRSERICSLARFVMSLESSPAQTAADAVAGADAGRQRQPPAGAAAGVSGGRRRADPLPERGRRAGGLSAGDRPAPATPNCRSWPRRTS